MSAVMLPVIDSDIFRSQPSDSIPVLEECKKVKVPLVWERVEMWPGGGEVVKYPVWPAAVY